MYKIGELSKLCKIPVKTLRYYDSEGLLTPDKIDKFTGYRFYSAARLADCYRIIALKELGFKLEEIKKYLNQADIMNMLNSKEDELIAIKQQTESQLLRISKIKENLKGDDSMFNIIIRNSDKFKVAFKREIFAKKEDALIEIKKIQNELPLSIQGKRIVIVNYETEHSDCDFDLGIGVEITATTHKYEQKEILFNTDMASLVCNQEQLDNAYVELIKYGEYAPYQIIGAFYEIYYEDGTVELKVPVRNLSVDINEQVNDDNNIEFIDDPEVVGKWEFVDIVPSKEQFNISKPKYKNRDFIWLENIYFLPKGEGYWIIDKWTKGCFFTSYNYPKHTYKHEYTVEIVDNTTLLFVQMKDYEQQSKGGIPLIWVYKKVNSASFKKDDIRIYDNIDYPFVSDDNVLGKWNVCDLVRSIDEFSPGKHAFIEYNMWILSLDFKENGTVYLEHSNLDGSSPFPFTWTRGVVINTKNLTASEYIVKNINGKDYMFWEWKSGDYIFGGRNPDYYVFEKV